MNTYVLEDEPSRRGSHTLGHRFKEASRGCAWRWGRGAVTIDNGRFNHLSGSEVNSSIAYRCIHTNTRGGRLIRPAAHSSERAELIERDVNINSPTIKLPGLTGVWRDDVPLTATWRFPSLLYLLSLERWLVFISSCLCLLRYQVHLGGCSECQLLFLWSLLHILPVWSTTAAAYLHQHSDRCEARLSVHMIQDGSATSVIKWEFSIIGKFIPINTDR